jgi:hypothetical protein
MVTTIAMVKKARIVKSPYLPLPRIISLFSAQACDFSDTYRRKRNGPRRLVLRPFHRKVVCGFLWSPLFTAANQAATPHDKTIPPQVAPPL